MQSINDSNYDFYRHIQIPTFEHYARLTGMDTGKDIDIIYPIIQKANTVVELGAGYGRATSFILSKGFKGKLILVERVPELITYLRQDLHITEDIIQQDIKKLQLEQPADILLWLWSGILELSQEEQANTIKQLYENLLPGGKLIIEAPFKQIKVVGSHTSEQLIKLETEWGTLTAYLPTPEEIEEDAKRAGFQSFQKINYLSETNLERVIYVLTK